MAAWLPRSIRRRIRGKLGLILISTGGMDAETIKSLRKKYFLAPLMHDPAIQYVSGGHLSTILKADDYVKVIRDFLGNI